jgi:hypothetical protein
MKKSTKLIMTGAASLLGVALATGGAYAASGSLTASDAPGQVLKVSGVGPASTHASDTAKAHANANAKGLFGTTATASPSATASERNTPAPTVSPVAPSVASKNASTVKGNQTGKSIEAWAHEQAGIHTVAPNGAVSVGVDASGTASH